MTISLRRSAMRCPPYNLKIYHKLLTRLVNGNWLTQQVIFINCIGIFFRL